MLPQVRFAVATATAKTLSRSVVAAAADLQAQLGAVPDFISMSPDDKGIQLGPAFLDEILRARGASAPVTIGAAVQVLRWRSAQCRIS